MCTIKPTKTAVYPKRHTDLFQMQKYYTYITPEFPIAMNNQYLLMISNLMLATEDVSLTYLTHASAHTQNGSYKTLS